MCVQEVGHNSGRLNNEKDNLWDNHRYCNYGDSVFRTEKNRQSRNGTETKRQAVNQTD